MRRSTRQRSITIVLAAVMMTWLLQGCTSQEHSIPPIETDTPYSHQKDSQVKPDERKPVGKQNEKTEIASPKNQSSHNGDSTYTDQAFDRAHPQLKGIVLASNNDAVKELWGEPEEHYVMDDTDPIDVYQYEGFSYGCKQDGKIIFVEVSGEDTSTGIQGLTIGDSEATASKVLGRPDHDTDYVWSYELKNCLLRLDLDPTTNKIQAVKLFSNERV